MVRDARKSALLTMRIAVNVITGLDFIGYLSF
jgi:hypothetical protein